MRKNRVYLSLILFLVLAITGGQVLQTDASSLREEDPFEIIDEQVWREILESPARETTFLVHLKPNGEMSIDAQFRLEEMLGAFQGSGSLSDYQSFYGRNIIKITGGAGILHFLADWPELSKVSSIKDEEAFRSHVPTADDLDIRVGTSQISGEVTVADGNTPLSGIRVTAYLLNPPVDWVVADAADTGTDGTFTISGLAAGIYRVRFVDPSGNYVTEYYDNKSSFALATNFDLGESQTVTNINAALSLAGKISGTVTLVEGGAEAGLVASAWSNASGSWNLISNAITNESGGYTIGGLAPGNYRVMFSDSSVYVPPRYVTEYFNNQLTIDAAQDVSVTAGVTTANINAALGSYGSVGGNVKAYDGTTNLSNISVDVYRYDSTYADWIYFATGTTDASGNYEVFGLGTENVRVGFFDPYDQFASEYYDDQSDLASANNVPVNLGEMTDNINAELDLKNLTLDFELEPGWNLVSLPLMLDENTLPAAFTSISGYYGDVWIFEEGQWLVFNPDYPPEFNDFSTVNTIRGYWINMNESNTLSFTGIQELNTTIQLYAGWNLIGYPAITDQPVESALTSIDGKYTLVQQYKASDQSDPWKIYNPDAPSSLNDLKALEPGFGYWIYMLQDALLNINGR